MADPQGRELDAAVAERVMGWIVHPERSVHWGQSPDEDRWHTRIPHYSTSHDAVATVRAEIERRGLVREFTAALLDVLIVSQECGEQVFSILCATPAQQCKAALEAVRCER